MPVNAQIQLQYQIAPIILTGGSAANTPDGMLSLQSVISGNNSLGLPVDQNNPDNSFGAFNVLVGGTLISQTIAKYPFANQRVAANATIQEPLTISVIMDAPMRGPNAWQQKKSVMTKLQGTLDRHNIAGGTYTVVTPAFNYTNLIMLSLTDNSRGNNTLPQNAWRFDFEKPLVSIADLQGAQNDLTTKLTNQTPTAGNTSGPQPGQQSANPSQSRTIKTEGGIIGGSPNVLRRQFTSRVFNYPALPSPASFPFTGLS